MSKIKTLKTDPNNNVNVVDILSLVVPSEKTVYLETLLRLMKNTANFNEVNAEIKAYLQKTFGTDEKTLNEIPPFHLMFYYRFIDAMFAADDLEVYRKFIDYNERKLIENNDIAKYTSFDDVKNAVSLVDMKLMIRELEKQTVNVFEDEEYLIVRPLTYLSSKKYGANTKWCTTSQNDYSYFRRYAKDGILLYILNKVTGVKVGVYYSLLLTVKEFSFWDQADIRVDSMESGLPPYILDIIKTEVTINRRTNRSYLTKDEIDKDDSLNMGEKKALSMDVSFGGEADRNDDATDEIGEEAMEEDGGEVATAENASFTIGLNIGNLSREQEQILTNNRGQGELAERPQVDF